MRWVAMLLVVAAVVPAHADLIAPERLEAWQLWREQPLDLRRADVDELALLPGADHGLARAVVALRDVRPDFTRADLLGVEGLDPHTLDAWEELVVLDAVVGLEADLTAENGAARLALRARRGTWTGGVIARDQPGVARGWFAGRMGAVDLVAGALRVDFGSGLGVGDVLGRSRSGAVGSPRAGRIRGRTDGGDVAGWSGIGLAVEGRASVLRFLIADDADDVETWVVGWDRNDGASGMVLVGRGASTRLSVWTRRAIADGVEVWGEGSSTPGAGSGSTAIGGRARRPGGGASATWVRSDAATRDGRDPITGAALDRTHGVWQVEGHVRQGPHRLEAWWRHRTRDGATDERLRVEWRWTRPRVRDDAERWSARAGLGIDEDDAGDVEPHLRWEVQRSTSTGRVLVAWSRRGAALDAAEAFALRVRHRIRIRRPESIEIGLAATTRARSAPWFVVRPLAGVRPLWIPGHGQAAWVAIGTRVRGVELGAWTWWRGPVEADPVGWGVAIRSRVGPMARRLRSSR